MLSTTRPQAARGLPHFSRNDSLSVMQRDQWGKGHGCQHNDICGTDDQDKQGSDHRLDCAGRRIGRIARRAQLSGQIIQTDWRKSRASIKATPSQPAEVSDGARRGRGQCHRGTMDRFYVSGHRNGPCHGQGRGRCGHYWQRSNGVVAGGGHQPDCNVRAWAAIQADSAVASRRIWCGSHIRSGSGGLRARGLRAVLPAVVDRGYDGERHFADLTLKSMIDRYKGAAISRALSTAMERD